MDISKYASYFHDGALYDIKHTNDTIELYFASAEVDPEDIEDNIPLGKYDRIKGVLHLEGIKKITRNKLPVDKKLNMEHPRGNIFNLNIAENFVELQIDWEEVSPQINCNDFSTIKIEADKIYWENKPDLVDPYW